MKRVRKAGSEGRVVGRKGDSEQQAKGGDGAALLFTIFTILLGEKRKVGLYHSRSGKKGDASKRLIY